MSFRAQCYYDTDLSIHEHTSQSSPSRNRSLPLQLSEEIQRPVLKIGPADAFFHRRLYAQTPGQGPSCERPSQPSRETWTRSGPGSCACGPRPKRTRERQIRKSTQDNTCTCLLCQATFHRVRGSGAGRRQQEIPTAGEEGSLAQGPGALVPLQKSLYLLLRSSLCTPIRTKSTLSR